MAFWGVEVKPGKKVTHSCEKARGRLRISQATLGSGEATKKSVVQCNVGNRSPVLFCVLLPGRTESCHLDLEFEEADDVVFSVLGPRSVYLTGYYVRQNQQFNGRSDTESYGVDIENTQTDGSNYNSDDDDKYEDSFINDDELQFSPGSPILGSKGLDEVMLEKEPKDKKVRGKSLRKKQWVIESDNDANSLDKVDEDGFSLSLDESKRDVKTTTCDAGANSEKIAPVTVEMDDEAKDDGLNCSETKQNAGPLDISDKIERVSQPPLDEEGGELNNGNNELLEQVQSLEEMIVSNQEVICGSNINETLINQNLATINGKNKMQTLYLATYKKKRKERPLIEKTSKVPTDDEDPSVPIDHKEHEAEASADLGIGEYHLMTVPESDSANGQKSKKRRNELLEGDRKEETDEKSQNITEDDLLKQDLLLADHMIKHQVADNGEYERQQKSKGTSMEKFGVEYHNVQREDEVMQGAHADSKTEDLPAATGENQEDQIDSIISAKSELLANDNQLGQKIKKKRKKTRGKKDNMSVVQMSDNQENEDQSIKPASIDKRTLSNGLTIEELESGPPGGKVAVPGKNVTIYYTGKLMESGHVFDSNMGQAAYKLLLGDEEMIEGWNAGIDGMRVGDKRRLILPPSMGFGDQGSGDDVPPDSWVIYEIELVSVRR